MLFNVRQEFFVRVDVEKCQFSNILLWNHWNERGFLAAETEQPQFEHFLVGNHFIVNEDVSMDERIDPVQLPRSSFNVWIRARQ